MFSKEKKTKKQKYIAYLLERNPTDFILDLKKSMYSLVSIALYKKHKGKVLVYES